MSEINPAEALKTLMFEMTASRDLGRMCANYMDISEHDLYYVEKFVKGLLEERSNMVEINEDDFYASFEWSESKTKAVQAAITDWIMENQIFHSESVYQTDTGLVESPTLVAQIIDILDIEVSYV